MGKSKSGHLLFILKHWTVSCSGWTALSCTSISECCDLSGKNDSLGTCLGMRGYEGRSRYFRICAASQTEEILHLSCLDGGDIRWKTLSNLKGANRSRVAILGIGGDRNVSLCDRMTLKYDHSGHQTGGLIEESDMSYSTTVFSLTRSQISTHLSCLF